MTALHVGRCIYSPAVGYQLVDDLDEQGGNVRYVGAQTDAQSFDIVFLHRTHHNVDRLTCCGMQWRSIRGAGGDRGDRPPPLRGSEKYFERK